MIRRRFTIDDYQHMHASGILKDSDRVELLDGDVHVMGPIGHRHFRVVARLNRVLSQRLFDKAFVSIQGPAILSEVSEPQPDVAVFAYSDNDYAERMPTVAETLLLIEVADSSLRFDRDTKMPLYGRSGIQEAWLVDLPNEIVYRFTNPTPEGYAAPEEFRPGDTLTANIAGVELKLNIAELLA